MEGARKQLAKSCYFYRMLVSIITPCFNGERFVREAIDSALAQTYPNVEVIVIDDGSTDGTLEILKSYGDRIRWETGPNRGACAARNRGLELARGELIQFLDADDLLCREKLAVQVPASTEWSGAVLFCDMQVFDQAGEDVSRAFMRREVSADGVCQILASNPQTSCVLHRREHLETIGGFRIDLPCAQERDLHLRLAARGAQFRRLDRCLVVMRRQPNSLSNDSLRVLDQHAGIVTPVYEELVARGEMTDERARAFAGLMAKDARAYLRAGRREDAERYFALARRFHPDGGLTEAYSTAVRRLRAVAGPYLAERLVSGYRRARAVRGSG